jgi:prepilin-type N-terminal cleavage/methylation domain-containing protein
MHDKVEQLDSLTATPRTMTPGARTSPARALRGSLGRGSLNAAFTLTELLVVMGIVVILLAVGVPAVKALMNSGTADTAVNAISAVAANARAHATRGKTLLGTEYKGSAMIAWPVLNDDGDVTGVELRVADHVQPSGSSEKNLYQNLAGLESVRLPDDSGVVGIFRGGSGSGVTYLHSPPFAVRFDASGHLIARRTETAYSKDLIDYDEDGDDTPDETNLWTTVGLLVYSNKGLTGAGNDLPDPGTNLSGGTASWILNNGEPVFFNRYSGAIMEEE